MSLHTRVIGIGSPHGDDQVGWRIAERVRQRREPRTEAVCVDEPSAILDYLSDCDRVVLVDACLTGGTPGTVRRWVWPAVQAPSLRPCSTHGLGLIDCLRLADQLGRLPRQVVLLGLELEHCRPGSGLRPALDEGLDELERSVLAEVEREL